MNLVEYSLLFPSKVMMHDWNLPYLWKLHDVSGVFDDSIQSSLDFRALRR